MMNFDIHVFVLHVLLTMGSVSGSSEWRALGNSSYLYMATPLSFPDARNKCHEFGGDLAQIKTQEINDFVADLVGSYRAVWFGLTDLDEECTYKWIDGSLLDNSFSSWEGNETVICHQQKDCIQLEQGSWGENNCSNPLGFVCARSGVYSEQVLESHLLVSDPYAFLDDLKVFFIVGQEENQSLEMHYSYTEYQIHHIFRAYAFTSSLSASYVTGLNTLSLVNELLVHGYHSTGKLECRLSSESDQSSTVVSAIHLRPDRESQPSNGRFTMSAYPGTNITLNVTSRYDRSEWYFFESGDYRGDNIYRGFSYDIASVREEDEGIYSTCVNDCRFYEDPDSLIRLIIVDCPPGRWGPSSCLGVCDPCYNGGICHERSGSCICPPGFTGKNCLQACGEHRFGSNCDIMCGLDEGLNVTCAGSQICRPDPYGCNCLAGYTGVFCNETCRTGHYGVDCLQDCHCSGGSACEIFSGECPGDCADGWSGPSCQVPAVCPDGFYGEYCTEVCHCPNYESCNVDTGYCIDSDGVCAVGYVTGPSRNTFCDIYTGCFDSCTKTCHCSEGASDCNSVIGTCFSGKCSSGWTGPTCQIVSPRLIEPPSSVYTGCDTIAISWSAWDPDRDFGESPIGGYYIYLKSKTSDWSKIAFVTQDSNTTDVLGHVLFDLEQDVEYMISVTPVHVSDLGKRPTYLDNGQELVTRTLQCVETVSEEVTMAPSTNGTVGRSRSEGTVPWALFGVTLVLFLACGGVLGGFWVYTKRTSTNTTPETTSSPSPSPSGTKASSANDYIYDNPTFSTEAGTSEHTYQDLYKGPKNSVSKVPKKSDQEEYSEIQVNPPELVYENNRVKVF